MTLKRSRNTSKPAHTTGTMTPSPSSKRSTPQTSSSSSPRKKAKSSSGRSHNARSIWNSKDDWQTLLSESSLSTSSVSLRPPRMRGLNSLVRCSTESISRGFKRLWESSAEPALGSGGASMGTGFKFAWVEVPEHLKAGVRDQVYRMWGAYLSLKMIADLFLIPPHLYLPGEILSSISETDRLKELVNALPDHSKGVFTSLTLTHCGSVTDIGVAGLIYHLPNLQAINLKGCTRVSSRTIKTIVDRCKDLKRINLKGTKVGEEDVKLILDTLGKQLVGFKVDNVAFENINSTFASAPYPHLTHLCLPGSFLNAPTNNSFARGRLFGTSHQRHTVGYLTPRPVPEGSIVDWPVISEAFPNLTHLYLPGLLVPPDTTVNLPQGLIKFSLGAGGLSVPLSTVIQLLATQTQTLRSVHLGHLKPKALSSGSPDPTGYEELGRILSECEKLESFKLEVDRGRDTSASRDVLTDTGMSRFADLIYAPGLGGSWQKSLKHLTLSTPQTISAINFLPATQPAPGLEREERAIEQSGSSTLYGNGEPEERSELDLEATAQRSPLETLELPLAAIDDPTLLAHALSGFKGLRSLDLSGTTIRDEDMKVILDACPLLSRIDLTSCRGINVRHRRNIFQALLPES